MSREAFYSVLALKPPLGVSVVVCWDGRIFESARVNRRWLDERKIKLRRKVSADEELWLTTYDGELFILPDQKAPPFNREMPWWGFHRLGDGPSFWRPQSPSMWRAALPPVAFYYDPSEPGRMWTARQEYSATDAALDAEEMEADREFHVITRETDTADVRVSHSWWRIPAEIKYETPETLTKKMAEGRVFRALAFADPFRGYGRKYPRISRVLEALSQADIRLRGDNAPPESDLGLRLEPVPADHSDFLTALGWYCSLNPPPPSRGEPWGLSPGQKVLAWRSFPVPLSYRECGDRLKVSKQRAHDIQHEAIEAIWRVGAALDESPAVGLLNELRERNKRFKRANSDLRVGQ